MSSPASSTLSPAQIRVVTRLLLPATLLVLIVFIAARRVTSPILADWLDNLHWTIAYLTAMRLGWYGVEWSDPETRAARRWFAYGLTACALGQLLWDYQTAFGSNDFPAPSDFLFLCFGPCCVYALLLTVRQHQPRASGWALTIDVTTLAVVVLAIVLALYLPVRVHDINLNFAMTLLYPLSMLTVTCVGLVIWPTLRLKAQPGWLVMFFATTINGILWLQWIYFSQNESVDANSWLFLAFSLVTLTLGVGNVLWRVESSSEPRWARRSDNLLRMMPLIVVVGAAVSVVLAWSLPGVLHAVAVAIYASGAIVLVLATLRQSLLLVDRDRMLASERRASELERNFQALFLIPHGGLALLDYEGRFLEANPGCSTLLGYDHETLRTMRAGDLCLTPDEHKLGGPLGLVSEAGIGTLEVLWQRSDGRQVYLEITSALIPDSNGQLFVLFRDITERKQAAEAQARLEAQLRQSQKLEAIGTLASGIAHDFNNILSAILGNIELALQDMEFTHPARGSLQEVRKSGHRARELIRRIVAFGKPQELNFHASQLGAVVDDSMKLVRAALPATVQIQSQLDMHMPLVRADSSQIAQVLLNLCTNACQAMPQQKGIIRISLSQCEVHASDSMPDRHLTPGRYACLNVSDTGSGIDRAIVDRIFEPFFTTKPQGEGSGLGLSIVHNIIRNHGGAITVVSQPDAGTHFRIYLPLLDSNDQPSTTGSSLPAPAARGAGQHIVYVDDEEALVLLTVKMLERLGYRVTGYTDADTALRAILADHSDVDVVITDLSMPGMSGMELAKKILAQRSESQLILVSGYMPADEIERAHDMGFRAVILKPDTIDQLAETIHRLLTE